MISNGSFRRRKQRNITPLYIVLLLFPYIVGFTSDSTSSYVETLFGAGTGQYVYHDCSGAHSQRYSDVGISVTKKFEGPYRTGLHVGGWTAGKKGGSPYIFPDLALDWTFFSFGTTGVRIGSREKFYFEGRWLDQPPVFSGKGALRAGFGGTIKSSNSRFWLGTNLLPYNNLGLAAQLDFPYSEQTFIFVNGRFGAESGMSELGISLGIRYISF